MCNIEVPSKTSQDFKQFSKNLNLFSHDIMFDIMLSITGYPKIITGLSSSLNFGKKDKQSIAIVRLMLNVESKWVNQFIENYNNLKEINHKNNLQDITCTMISMLNENNEGKMAMDDVINDICGLFEASLHGTSNTLYHCIDILSDNNEIGNDIYDEIIKILETMKTLTQ